MPATNRFMRILPIVTTLGWSGHLAASAEASGPPTRSEIVQDVDVLARFESAAYCGRRSDTVVTLRVALELTVRNRRSRPVIMARGPSAGPPRLAASTEAGLAGLLEWEPGSWNRLRAGGSPPQFGDSPDPEVFSVVTPGQSAVTTLVVPLLVRQGAEFHDSPGTLVEGSRHALQVQVEWWAPFFGVKDDEIASVAQRWRDVGELAIGRSMTSWVEFQVPPIQHLDACSAGTP